MSEREEEALAFVKALVGAWDCCGTCAGGVLAAHDERVRAEVLAPVRALAEEITQWADGVKDETSAEVGRWIVRRLAALSTERPAGAAGGITRVHNHAPWRPMCSERSSGGQLRGACLNDDGTEPLAGEAGAG